MSAVATVFSMSQVSPDTVVDNKSIWALSFKVAFVSGYVGGGYFVVLLSFALMAWWCVRYHARAPEVTPDPFDSAPSN